MLLHSKTYIHLEIIMDDKIIRRAKALLAMSQDASSENEAMLALKRLHTLLAKHNMSTHDLNDTTETVESESFDSIRWPWKTRVAMSICKLYFCEFYFIPTRKNHCSYTVVGTEFNRSFAVSTIQNAFRFIEGEGRRQSKAQHGKLVSGFVSSFNNGASSRIYTRCMELIAYAKSGEMQDEDGNNMPMLVNVYASHATDNKAFLDTIANLTTRAQNARASDAAGYQAGAKAGNSVRLSQEIQHKNRTLLIG